MVASTTSVMSRETGFLLASVRCFLLPNESKPDTAGIDMPEVQRLARRHAVQGMLFPDVKDSALQLSLIAELERLAAAFDAQNIRFIPLKGPLLSQRLHGNLAIRSSSDID